MVRWASKVNAGDLFLSVITLWELELGVLLKARRDPAQGTILRQWLNGAVMPEFARRTLPIDTAVAMQSASLHVPASRPVRDSFIAATALVHGKIVVTRNEADFEPMGVPLLNPWS